MGLISAVSQSLYLLLVQSRSSELSALETLHLNSFNTFPFLFVTSIILGEFQDAVVQFHFQNIGFVLTFTFVISMGSLLNYLLFLCTCYNSALTTSVTGTLKSILQTGVGMFVFGGMSFNIWSALGVIMNMSGGILYSYSKYSENQQRLMIKSKSGVELNGVPSEGAANLTENSNTLQRHSKLSDV